MPHAAGGVPLERVGVVTRDRPDLLRRVLASVAANASRYGRRCRLVVADDSPDPSMQERNRTTLSQVSAEHGVGAGYAGPAEKERYAVQLAAASGAPLPIVRFALLGDDRYSTSIGANRNALILDAASESFVMLDDDVVVSFASPDAPLPGLALGLDDPTLFRFFPNRRAVLDGVRGTDVDLLSLYGEDLGRHVADLVREAEPDVVLGERSAAMLQAARSPGATVAVSLTGTFGDIGVRYGTRLLWSVRDEARADMLRSEAQYRVAKGSREVLRVAPRKSITRPSPFHTTTVALDVRTLIPPFSPALRGSDRVFGVMMSACCPNAFATHLPYAMLHAPEERRTYDVDWVSGAALSNWDDIALAIMVGDPLPHEESDVGARLHLLGERFARLGSVPTKEFEAHVHDRRVSYGRYSALSIRALLGRKSAEPLFWSNDVRAHLDVLEESMTTGKFFVPEDLRHSGNLLEVWRESQRLVGRLGELLEYWPRLFDAAQELKSQGTALPHSIR